MNVEPYTYVIQGDSDSNSKFSKFSKREREREMQHEILLALVGHTGDIIVQDSSTFKVKSSLSRTFISDADRQVCVVSSSLNKN
jgi:hypothetical protein